MSAESDAYVEELLGKGMQIGPEIAHLDYDSTFEDMQAAEKAYREKMRAKHEHISQFPLLAGQTYTFKGESLRECGINQPRLSGARPSLNIQANSQYSLTLEHCFRGGNQKWAQVWRCIIEGEGVAARTKVVLKLYQESNFPIVDGAHFYIEEELFGTLTQPAPNYARREAAGYAKLAEQQGLLIPYCYGFHLFDILGQETVEGVILEEIVGINHVDYLKKHAKQIPIQIDQVTLVADLYCMVFKLCHFMIGKYSVVHRDLGLGNIIIVAEDPLRLAILDFGHSLTPDTMPLYADLEHHARFPLNAFRDSIERLITQETRREVRNRLPLKTKSCIRQST